MLEPSHTPHLSRNEKQNEPPSAFSIAHRRAANRAGRGSTLWRLRLTRSWLGKVMTRFRAAKPQAQARMTRGSLNVANWVVPIKRGAAESCAK